MYLNLPGIAAFIQIRMSHACIYIPRGYIEAIRYWACSGQTRREGFGSPSVCYAKEYRIYNVVITTNVFIFLLINKSSYLFTGEMRSRFTISPTSCHLYQMDSYNACMFCFVKIRRYFVTWVMTRFFFISVHFEDSHFHWLARQQSPGIAQTRVALYIMSKKNGVRLCMRR